MRSGQVPRLEEVVVLALASSRLARAVSVDEIAAPARGRVSEWASRCGHRGLPKWLDRLMCCPLCTGWWFSIVVSLVAPGRQRLLRGVSVAGAQVMLSLAERLVSEEGRAAIEQADLLHEAVATPDGESEPDGEAVHDGQAELEPEARSGWAPSTRRGSLRGDEGAEAIALAETE